MPTLQSIHKKAAKLRKEQKSIGIAAHNLSRNSFSAQRSVMLAFTAFFNPKLADITSWGWTAERVHHYIKILFPEFDLATVNVAVALNELTTKGLLSINKINSTRFGVNVYLPKHKLHGALKVWGELLGY